MFTRSGNYVVMIYELIYVFCNRITIVFKLEDSTSIIYKVSKDLVKPVDPERTKLIKEKEEKRSNLEKEIRKNTSYLYELAKSLTTEDANEDKDTDVSHSSKTTAE